MSPRCVFLVPEHLGFPLANKSKITQEFKLDFQLPKLPHTFGREGGAIMFGSERKAIGGTGSIVYS